MVWIADCSPPVTDCVFEHCYGNSTSLEYDANPTAGSAPIISGNVVTEGYYGIRLTGNSSHVAQVLDNTVAECTYGVYLSGGSATVSNNTLSQTSLYGLYCTNLTDSSLLEYLVFVDNDTGYYLASGYGDIHSSNFIGSASYGVQNGSGVPLDATGNYWGDVTGPIHPSNPNGEGDAVSDDVDFIPFATVPFEGGGGAPTIALDPSSFIVELFPDETSTETLTISNLGELTLLFTIDEASRGESGERTDIPWMAVNPSSGAVPGGGAIEAELQLSSVDLGDGTYSAALVIESNDPLNDLSVIPVAMKVSHVFLRGPAPGDTLVIGQEYTIHWDLEDPGQVQDIDLVYSTDGGATYPHIIASGISPMDPFDWSVSEPLGDECLIMLTAHFVSDDDYEDISSGFFIIISDPTQVDDDLPIQALALAQNYPNPFNPKTTFAFALPEAATVSLNVYNLSGQLMAIVVPLSRLDPGLHSFEWEALSGQGKPLASGVYIYRLNSNGEVMTRKLILLK